MKGNWNHKYYEGTGFKKGHKRCGGVLIKEGEHRGKEFKKGDKPWNYNKKGVQPSTRKGKTFPEYSGANHPNFKGGISLEYKKKHTPRPKTDICEICGHKGIICYEHDHRTGNFRGWVCSSCNCIMGFANDDIVKLEKIIEYLKKNAAE